MIDWPSGGETSPGAVAFSVMLGSPDGLDTSATFGSVGVWLVQLTTANASPVAPNDSVLRVARNIRSLPVQPERLRRSRWYFSPERSDCIRKVSRLLQEFRQIKKRAVRRA